MTSQLPQSPLSARSLPSLLGPSLLRLLLGLALLLGGLAAAWSTVNSELAPGLAATDAAQQIPLQQADAVSAELTTDRGRITVMQGELPQLELAAHHRKLNPLVLSAAQQGSTLNLHARLLVDPPPAPTTIALQPLGEAVEHQLKLQVPASVPLHLSTRSSGGEQQLNLSGLALASLDSRSRMGDQTIQLPAGTIDTVHASTGGGKLNITAPPQAQVGQLSAETAWGDLTTDLTAARVAALHLSTRLGDITARLPGKVSANIQSDQGDLDLTLPPGASGHLRLGSNPGASIDLTLPAQTALRLRFSDLSREQALAQAQRLPANLVYRDGAYLSAAALTAPSDTPMLDIELDGSLPPELNLTLIAVPTPLPQEPTP